MLSELLSGLGARVTHTPESNPDLGGNHFLCLSTLSEQLETKSPEKAHTIQLTSYSSSVLLYLLDRTSELPASYWIL